MNLRLKLVRWIRKATGRKAKRVFVCQEATLRINGIDIPLGAAHPLQREFMERQPSDLCTTLPGMGSYYTPAVDESRKELR